jgi:hypothetical protein
MMELVLEYLLLLIVALSFINGIHKAEASLPVALAAYAVWRLQKVT